MFFNGLNVLKVWYVTIVIKKGKKMKKGLKILVTMFIAMFIAMSSVMPAFALAEGDVTVCSDGGVVPCSDDLVYHYKYDENGRLMVRIWSEFKQMYVTDWTYV